MSSNNPTRSQLLDAIRESGAAFLKRARALPPDALDAPRNAWTARQLIAHVAAIEPLYARYVDLARLGEPDPAWPPGIVWTTPDDAPDIPTMSARGGLDAFNAREVERRAGRPLDGVLAEFERNRAATIASVETADEQLLDTPIRTVGGVTGRLAAVLYRVAVAHVREHTADLTSSRGGEQP